MKNVAVLGASGSIGKNSIDIIKAFPERFKLVAFSVNKNIDYANALKKEFPDAKLFIASKQSIKKELSAFISESNADIAVNGISGASGLLASVACLEAKVNVALANKESIVMAADLLKRLALKNAVKIIPVDSEHSAIFSLINAFGKDAVKKIIITASGGPFRKSSLEDLENVTVEQALSHPTWSMGGKISIDSASLANKALEVIEAVCLFDFPPESICVTIHPESIIHSMIQLSSGEIYAQCSPPDMRFPILQALDFPNLAPAYVKALDFTKSFSLHFEAPRWKDFPLLKMGFDVAKKAAAYPIAFNAANEVAVEKFLAGKITFLSIAKIVQRVLKSDWNKKIESFDDVFMYDKLARDLANL